MRIVPTLCVGTPLGTLRVPALKGTRSVHGCIPTQSVGTISLQEILVGKQRRRATGVQEDDRAYIEALTADTIE